jgi:hypothetical protein
MHFTRAYRRRWTFGKLGKFSCDYSWQWMIEGKYKTDLKILYTNLYVLWKKHEFLIPLIRLYYGHRGAVSLLGG